MKVGIKKIVDDINNGDIDNVLPLFGGDFNMLFTLLKKHDALKEIDPFDTELEDYQHEILDYLLNEINDPKTWEYTISQIDNDLEKVGEDYYLVIGEIEELSDLFYEGGRDVSPKDVAKSVLSEDWWEPFYNATDNVYYDVIENLNEENLNYLKIKIVDELDGIPVVASEDDFAKTDVLEEIAKEQDNTQVVINSSNIDRIINDEETMKYLLENYLDDMDSDLHSLYSSSYNNAYTSEIYNDVWDELSGFFDVKSKEWVPHKNFKGDTRYTFRLKLNPGLLHDVISKYVEEDRYDNLGYISYFFGVLQQLIEVGEYEPLDFRVSDYPDYSEVVKDLNENFGSYF